MPLQQEAYLNRSPVGVSCRERSLRFQVSLANTVKNTSGARLLGGNIDVVIAAPSQNLCFSITSATPSPRVDSGAESNTHAHVKIPELEAERTFESRIDIEYRTASLSFQLGESIPSGDFKSLDEYCRAAKFWEIKDPLIRQTSERIRRSSSNVEDFLSRAFVCVRDNLKLRDPQPIRLGAARAMRERTGDCDELSDLFIALCRAVGVPCRRVVGLFYHARGECQKSFDWHAWAEVRLSNDVWVPFDPSLGFYAKISERHIPRCCMGRRSDYPIRKLSWRSRPIKPPVLNDDDVQIVTALSS